MIMLRFEAAGTLKKLNIGWAGRDSKGVGRRSSVQVRYLDWQRGARTNGELIDRLDNVFGRDGRKACESVRAGVAQAAWGAGRGRGKVKVGGVADLDGGDTSAQQDDRRTFDCAGEVGQKTFKSNKEERGGLDGGGLAEAGATAQVKCDAGNGGISGGA